MKAAFLDPENHVTKEINLDNDDMFYNQARARIRCDYITMTRASADNIRYVIVCDDCGLLKSPPRPVCISGLGIRLVGPCIILGDDGVDDVRGLSRTELKRFGCDGSGDGTATMSRVMYMFDKAFTTATDAEAYLKEYLED